MDPADVGKSLVDGDALDGRREIAQHSDGGVAKPLVFVEMAADEHEVGTELPRPSSRHAAAHTEGPRFVGGREHDAAADGNRLAAEARVEELFDRRVKGVEVRVEDGGGESHLVARPGNAILFAFYSPPLMTALACPVRNMPCVNRLG